MIFKFCAAGEFFGKRQARVSVKWEVTRQEWNIFWLDYWNLTWYEHSTFCVIYFSSDWCAKCKCATGAISDLPTHYLLNDPTYNYVYRKIHKNKNISHLHDLTHLKSKIHRPTCQLFLDIKSVGGVTIGEVSLLGTPYAICRAEPHAEAPPFFFITSDQT
jgi:hypothetical protein